MTTRKSTYRASDLSPEILWAKVCEQFGSAAADDAKPNAWALIGDEWIAVDWSLLDKPFYFNRATLAAIDLKPTEEILFSVEKPRA